MPTGIQNGQKIKRIHDGCQGHVAVAGGVVKLVWDDKSVDEIDHDQLSYAEGLAFERDEPSAG